MRDYARSIALYVQDGQLVAPSELYYPIRLKPRGQNRLQTLVENGIDHIEVRCVDLNPLVGGLVDARDIEFVRLFFLWCIAQPRETLSAEKQAKCVGHFKAAALLEFDSGCLATIHMDPVDVNDEETAKMKAKVADIIKETDPVITFHDFRMVSGPTHTNVIFDIVVPHDYKLTDNEIAKVIADKIHSHDERYFAVIDVDKDFTAHQQI